MGDGDGGGPGGDQTAQGLGEFGGAGSEFGGGSGGNVGAAGIGASAPTGRSDPVTGQASGMGAGSPGAGSPPPAALAGEAPLGTGRTDFPNLDVNVDPALESDVIPTGGWNVGNRGSGGEPPGMFTEGEGATNAPDVGPDTGLGTGGAPGEPEVPGPTGPTDAELEEMARKKEEEKIARAEAKRREDMRRRRSLLTTYEEPTVRTPRLEGRYENPFLF